MKPEWELKVDSGEQHAARYLRFRGLPVTWAELQDVDAPDYATAAAIRVIESAHHLREKRKNNQIDDAIDLALDVMQWAHEFEFYCPRYGLKSKSTSTPDIETLRSLIATDQLAFLGRGSYPPNDVIIHDRLYREVWYGHMMLSGARSIGVANRTDDEKVREWREAAELFHKDLPSLTLNRITELVSKECGGAGRTISRHIRDIIPPSQTGGRRHRSVRRR